jgi:TrmH family RNA methyltransferase
MNEIKSRKNPLIVRLKKLGESREYRHEEKEFLCDGSKLFTEAVQNGADITAVLTSGEVPGVLPDNVPVYKVDEELLKSVSPLKTPQDILFSCRIPSPKRTAAAGGFQIILEAIQDPGNVGTVIRTANAFGAGRVILTGGCADPYNPKTVRATMGAVFRQTLAEADFDDIVRMKTQGIKLYGAALCEGCMDVREAKLRNAAVAIGSEGHGLSKEMLELCDEKIIIPMMPGSESLNAAVAAAIIIWEAGKG